MPGDGENGDPGIDTSKPKEIDAQPPKFEGSSSADCFTNNITGNITYPFGLGGAKSLRLSQMTSIYDYSSLPCIFRSPRFKSPDLSKHLERHSSQDLSNTDFSLEDGFEVGSGSGSSSRHEVSYSLSYRACDRMNSTWPDKEMNITQFDQNVPDREEENQNEKSDSDSLGIDTSDILLLDSPNEVVSLNNSLRTPEVSYSDQIAPNSEDNQNQEEGMIIDIDEIDDNSEDHQNEGEHPNLHCNSKRRCLSFESTRSPLRHLGEQPNLTKLKPADKQPNPAKPKFGSSSSCMVSGIGLHLNSLVPLPYSTVRQDSNNGLVVFMEQEEALHLNSHVPKPCSAVHQDSNNALPIFVEQKEAEERKISQSNLKNKRSRLENGEEIEGCKRCKCKKSKCLKLYCECFAGGVYCMDSCSCQECFNTPMHKEIVKETRKLILSRNPLAFEPRVTVMEIGKVDSSMTPASARHKKGCNCRKSSCLKKYCECYQGGVGCSIDCRCDGCKNSFGRKDGSQEEETIIFDNVENETILFSDVEHNQDSEFFPTPIKDGPQEEEEAIMFDNAGYETLLLNNLEHNQDSELYPTPIEAVRGEEKTQLPISSIKRPPWLSNLSVIPESSYNAGKRVGKENMLPPQPMFEKQLETIQQEDEPRVQFSPGNGIKTSSSSPNSKRVSSPYKAGGSSPSSSRSGRKKVLQSIP